MRGEFCNVIPSGETPRGVPLAAAIVEETRKRMLSHRILREGRGKAGERKKRERERRRNHPLL
jgi:hypothetical protein